MGILKVSVFVVQQFPDHYPVQVLDELFAVQLEVGQVTGCLLPERLARPNLIATRCEPASVVVGQDTGSVIAAGKHQTVVEVLEANVLVGDEVGHSASHGGVEDLHDGGVGVDFEGFIEGKAGIEGVHFGEGGDFVFLLGVESSQVGPAIEVHEYPSLGRNCTWLHI